MGKTRSHVLVRQRLGWLGGVIASRRAEVVIVIRIFSALLGRQHRVWLTCETPLWTREWASQNPETHGGSLQAV